MLKKLLAFFFFCTIAACAQQIDLTTQVKGTLPMANYITGTPVAKSCLRISDDGLSVVAPGPDCNAGGSGPASPAVVTTLIPLENCTPDQTGNTFYTVAALSNWYSAHWEFAPNQNGYVNCMVRIPHDMADTPNAKLVLELSSPDSTASHTANFQTCDQRVPLGSTLNAGTFSCDAAQTYNTVSTAYMVTSFIYNVQSPVVKDDFLLVKINMAATAAPPTSNILVYPYLQIDQNSPSGVVGAPGLVTSVFGRAGDVVAQNYDYTIQQIAGGAPLASPNFTGVPTAPTPPADDNTTNIATTAFVNTFNAARIVAKVFNATSCSLASNNAEWNCQGTVSWGTTLPDTNYMIDCSISIPQPAASYPIPAGYQASFHWVTKTTSGFTYVLNDDHSGANNANYLMDCVALR